MSRYLQCPSWKTMLTTSSIALIFAAAASTSAADPAPAYRPGKLLQTLLDGPMAKADEIVFAVRVSGRDHWYVNFGYYSCDYGPGPERGFGKYPDGKTLRGYGDGGRLCRLNLRSGKLTVLLDDPQGGVRDPQMHYDGKKILFSYRKGDTPTYHLYEINIDGSHLVQLTDGPDDDIEPTYLPDGGIMFGSSRCRRFVNCWFSRVATLYRCDGDGKNLRMISSNNDHDNTPWVLPDGRVLYMRWEYVDRSQVHFHHLWTVNPDGTSQMVYYGNEHGGVSMLDAKPIPGTTKVVASFSPGHGRPEHMGYITVVDPSAGPDVLAATKRISKGNEAYRDPFAISETCFLAANARGIYVMDGEGNKELVYKLPASDAHMECHDPRSLGARPRERIIPSRVDLTKKTGEMVLANVYNGRNMTGVKKGDIKKLLLLEQLPEPVHFSGGMEPLSIGGTFTMARILGTVPVEADGSAYFEVPALRSLFMVALDKDDLSVKRMHSFVTLQPGERTSCAGCHEQRTHTGPPEQGLLALTRLPSVIEAIEDVPDVIDYPRDVQPILDRHCVKCHGAERREGKTDLSGDHTPKYSISYWTMVNQKLFTDGRNQPYGNRPPRSIGSSASRLMKLIDGSHYDAKPSERERKTIRLWIDTSATYPGTYAALGSGMYSVRIPGDVLGRRCASCHVKGGKLRLGNVSNLQSLCNVTRPDKSLLLRAPLSGDRGGFGLCKGEVFADTKDPDYQKLLSAIEATAKQHAEQKRFDMPGFRPNRHYIREMQRFGFLPKDLLPNEPIDVYKTDRAYWDSFGHHPQRSGE
ncbi:MAG: hypothetical protein IID44_02725 [Planctomycetes bacterium]|nr:hypothetical protein [Planctomycetota bacterium]